MTTRDGRIGAVHESRDGWATPVDDPVLGLASAAEGAALLRDMPTVAEAMAAARDGETRAVALGPDGVALVRADGVELLPPTDPWAARVYAALGPDLGRVPVVRVAGDRLFHVVPGGLRDPTAPRETTLGEALATDDAVYFHNQFRADLSLSEGPVPADALPLDATVTVREARPEDGFHSRAEVRTDFGGTWWRVDGRTVNAVGNAQAVTTTAAPPPPADPPAPRPASCWCARRTPKTCPAAHDRAAARHALADAVASASAARDPADADRDYRAALAIAEPAVAPAVAVDHVSALLALGAVDLAERRCAEHLARFPGHVPLVGVRAEVRSAKGDHRAAAADAATALASASGTRRARLLRVEGLAAADRRDFATADAKLGEARALFARAGHTAGTDAVDHDRVAIAVRLHDPHAVDLALATDATTPAERLRHAEALRKRLRYEEALSLVLADALSPGLDPALRLPVVGELAVLLRLLRRDDAAERLTPLIAELDPSGATAARVWPETRGPDPTTVPDRVRLARQLVEEDRLADAESVLSGLTPATPTDTALWRLAAGELELARDALPEAVTHLATAADAATGLGRTELRVLALRRLGLACFRAGDERRAAECWSAAHRAEEVVAAAQDSDWARVRLLAAADTEHDHAIGATAQAAQRDPARAAAVVVAMEAARGGTLLAARDLPALRDREGTWRWLKAMTRDLHRDQALWLSHATSDRVHHAVLTRGRVRITSTPADVTRLSDAVAEFQAFLHPDDLPLSVESGDFDAALADLARRVGLDAAVALLPPTATRVTTIAAGPLSDLPWAALSTQDTPLVARFALSDLPSLSIRQPLRARSRRSRGDAGLLVSPPDGLTRAEPAGFTPLTDDRATVAALDARAPEHRVIRIDCHGVHDEDDPDGSWLTLAGGERLTAERLRRIPLRGTVTLGACESGMAQPRGRDEPVGFVRSALLAGASAVLAARWVAADGTAAALLDRFGANLRHLPRDIALQRAQLSIEEHPARWGCWALYGDPGFQTAAGPLRRRIRSSRAPVR
ncbi:CHAT domain-containing protein [Actinokineospora soli]|uniref:CHAT domain-containing protein n=1 Tax=Actinokineospora soli TaxID=1048753 RepID=A0ABW2TV45_9PSEU